MLKTKTKSFKNQIPKTNNVETFEGIFSQVVIEGEGITNGLLVIWLLLFKQRRMQFKPIKIPLFC